MANKDKDYYQILNVPRDASLADIKKGFLWCKYYRQMICTAYDFNLFN